MMNGARTPANAAQQQFAELAAQYESIAASIDKTKPPPIEALVTLTFLRVQMVDMKLDMLAIAAGAAKDPASRIVVPGRQ